MKGILYCMLMLSPIAAAAQVVNPTVIQRDTDIALHFTDAYYAPYPVPGDSDTRINLSNENDIILDSNGVGNQWRDYYPLIYDTFVTPHQYVHLSDFHLPGYPPLSRYAGWQRLFTARDKPSHNHSDMVAGGFLHDSVIISKNEDVDFRASGTIRLENGFHAKPGSFFHAYQEPKWGSAVFTDDFHDNTIDRSKWYIATNGTNAESGGLQCLFDSNVYIDTDYQATDGKALDIVMRENPCSCRTLDPPRACSDLVQIPLLPKESTFSSALVRACPWPLTGRSAPDSMVYSHMPYGKYEIREKVPAFIHHTNNWLYGGADFEIDMGEGNAGWQGTHGRFLNVHHRLRYGPFTGRFCTSSDTVFVSIGADWSLVNNPRAIYIDGFAYNVRFAPGHRKDSVIGADPLCWPASLLTGAPITFYYSRLSENIADKVTWSVDSSGRIFSAPYHVKSNGDTLRFRRDYQPGRITLRARIDTIKGDTTAITLNCHWSLSLNSLGDTGRLYLDTVPNDSTNAHRIVSSDLHRNTESFTYSVEEGLFDYPAPFEAMEWGDSAPSSYRYHRYGAEVLPHEIRIMLDSNVILRYPDRLVPPTNREFDFTTKLGRSWAKFYIGEFDFTGAADSASFAYASHAPAWAGFWRYHGQNSAHDMIDYVRVWDVPADVRIPNFPH